MTDHREVMRMALEVLEQLHGGCTDSEDGTVEAITVWCPEVIEALRAALDAPEKDAEPVVTVRLTREQHSMLTQAFDGYASLSPWKAEMLALLGTFPDAGVKP